MDTLNKDPHELYEHAKYVIKGRWFEAEPIIMQDQVFAFKYALHIICGRWPEAESHIMKSTYRDVYAAFVLTGDLIPYHAKISFRLKYPEFVDRFTIDWSEELYYYSNTYIKGRCLEAEPYISSDSYYSYEYANSIIKGRWPEAEPVIMKCKRTMLMYVRDIIRGRWIEAEPIFMQNKSYFTLYYNYISESLDPHEKTLFELQYSEYL